jgi:two-component system CheB/CheR fusion protein
LITFLDAGDAAEDQSANEQQPTNELVRSLREKLRQEEQHTESMRSDYNLATEDLRAANEELQSLNEEYRSTTEELETSKEELQSVNHELKLKLEEVSHANSDLENLMAANDVAMLFLDLECRISRFTPRLSEIFNAMPRDRGRPIGDLTHSLEYDAFESDVRKVLLNSVPIEHEVASRDGRVFMVRMSPYRKGGDGEIGGVVVTFIDVTAIKRTETALRESERKLLEQDQNKEAFLVALGHELRNPMAAIRNSLEVISVMDEPSRGAMVILKRQVHHMTRLVNDLLDISRINRGALRIEREVVDVNQSVQAAIEAVRREADVKGLSLELDLSHSPVYVGADSERLAQIFDNLLSNALKYTEHGRVTARVQRDTAQALITIRDTGIGMNPDQAGSLFDTAHQTEEGARKGGLGLGLQLVKRLVDLQEGTIEFRSDGRGHGSEVTLTLPLVRSAPPTVSPSADVAVPISRRILIVDDQPDTADALGLLLAYALT